MSNPKKFSAQIPALSKLNLEDENCLQQSWRKFKRSWDNYEIASNLIAETKGYRCAVLKTIIGEPAMEKYDGFKFDNAAAESDIDVVLKKFEEFCVGSTHEAFESYKFHIRNQEQSRGDRCLRVRVTKVSKRMQL